MISFRYSSYFKSEKYSFARELFTVEKIESVTSKKY
jgi:hypothetical protein